MMQFYHFLLIFQESNQGSEQGHDPRVHTLLLSAWRPLEQQEQSVGGSERHGREVQSQEQAA